MNIKEMREMIVPKTGMYRIKNPVKNINCNQVFISHEIDPIFSDAPNDKLTSRGKVFEELQQRDEL